MKKIFLYDSGSEDIYSSQLALAYKLLKKKDKDLKFIDTNSVEPEYINKYDIVISSNLSKTFENYAKKKKIILIYLDKFEKKNQCDIIIDYKYDITNNDFTGDNYKINKKLYSNFNFALLFDVIVVLKWDSSFWGYPVCLVTSRKLTDNIIYRINKFVKKNKVKLIQYLCNCHDRKSVSLAEQNRFAFKDIRLTFEKDLRYSKVAKNSLNKNFKIAKSKDVKQIYKISDSIYKDSRYYFDQNFDEKKVQEFYNLWLYKAVKNLFDNLCLIYCKNNKPISYCTLRYKNNNEAVIGLFGVSKELNGKGIGTKLINKVVSFLTAKGYKKITVVTQGRNLYAQRLYQKAGFFTKGTELWYHKWI